MNEEKLLVCLNVRGVLEDDSQGTNMRYFRPAERERERDKAFSISPSPPLPEGSIKSEDHHHLSLSRVYAQCLWGEQEGAAKIKSDILLIIRISILLLYLPNPIFHHSRLLGLSKCLVEIQHIKPYV